MLSLLRKAISFLARHLFDHQIRRFYKKRSFYLYKAPLEDEIYQAKPPEIPDFSLKIVTERGQMEELISQGFDLGWLPLKAEEWLKKGVVAFCVFIGHELVFISWVAMDKEAKDSLNEFPCPVDFSNGEAYLGWTAKHPKYWRVTRGVPLYVYFKVLQFLKERGVKACYFVVRKNNTLTQNTLAKRIPIRPYGEGYYLRVLRWKFWREKPLYPSSKLRPNPLRLRTSG